MKEFSKRSHSFTNFHLHLYDVKQLLPTIKRMFGIKAKQNRNLNFTHSDLSKTHEFQEMLKNKKQEFEAMNPPIPLSYQYLQSSVEKENQYPVEKLRPIKYFQFKDVDKYKLNRIAKKQYNKAITKVVKEDEPAMQDRLFFLDQTAEVLENYRRSRENKIFNRILHNQEEKRLALKKEALKLENILPKNQLQYQFFSDTKNQSAALEAENEKTLALESIKQFPNSDMVVSQLEDTPYSKYLRNKKRYKNLRVQQALEDNSKNPQVQELQNAGLLGNSPAISISLTQSNESNVDASTHKEEGTNLQEQNKAELEPDKKAIAYSKLMELQKEIREKQIFKEQIELAHEIKVYEEDVLKKHQSLDIYRKYSKIKNRRPTFSELSLPENLNYVKYNIRKSMDAFKMYKEIQRIPNVNKRTQITASLIQKIGIGVDTEVEKNRQMIMESITYEQMLRSLPKCLKYLDNKNVVDLFFAIAKIHKTDKPHYINALNYLFKQFLLEITVRMETLDKYNICFLCRALLKMKRNTPEEIQIRELIKEKCGELVPIMGELELSYISFYLIASSDQNCQKLLATMGKQFLSVCEKKNVELAPVNMIHMLKAFGIANDIFCDNLYIGKDGGLVGEFALAEMTIESELEYISKSIYQKLVPVIINQISEFSIREAGECLFYFGQMKQFDETLFETLSNHLHEQLLFKENYQLQGATYALWGISKYYIRENVPLFNLDCSSFIYPRYQFLPTGLEYRTFKAFTQSLLEKTDIQNPHLLSLLAYSSSSTNYFDKEFYSALENTFIVLLEKEGSLKIKDVGYLLQAFTMSNFYSAEYYAKSLDNLIQNIDFGKTYSILENLHGIAQHLNTYAYIGMLPYIASNPVYGEFFQNIGDTIADIIEDSCIREIPSLLWSLNELTFLTEDLVNKGLEICTSYFQSLTNCDCALLGQLILELQMKNDMSFEIEAETQNWIWQKAFEYEQSYNTVNDNYYYNTTGRKLTAELIEILETDYSKFMEYDLQQNQCIANMYFAPVASTSKKICIMFKHHFDSFAEISENSYVRNKMEQLKKEGYKILFINWKMFNDEIANTERNLIADNMYSQIDKLLCGES